MIWNFISSTATSDRRDKANALHQVAGLDWPVELRRHPRARRLKLRLDDKKRRLLLTMPPRTASRTALDWVAGQRDWANGQIAKVPEAARCLPGEMIMLEGEPVRLDYDPDGPRTPRRIGGSLICGGPHDHYEKRIGRWLLREAKRVLSEDVAQLAAIHGLKVGAISVGDADSRWGSCSSDGRLRFNWRLLMAPPEVRTYVVAHELAHRRHMDHSPAFHAAEKEIFGRDPKAERQALRRLSPDLRRLRLAR